MKSCCLLLLAFLLPPQRWTAQISGKIIGHDGKPVVGARIVYRQTGMVTDGLTDRPKIIEGTGRTYKLKTDKKGMFDMIGVDYGIYEITVTAPDGTQLYKVAKKIGDNADPDVSNALEVDLSKVPVGAVEPGAGTNVAAEKKTKEQEDLIRKESENGSKINKLVVEFHGALNTRDWATATTLLEQLIALDPNRWEFYQNLGTIQANQMHYQDSIKSFATGIEVAEKLLPSAADQSQAKSNIGDMLVSEGDAYNRLGKLNEAVTLYTKAAGISPKPATANFHACNALYNNNKPEPAIEACKLAISQDANQWEFYQVLGAAQNTAGKNQDAVETYIKGVDVARRVPPADPAAARAKAGLGQMLNSEGNLLVHEKRYEEALAVFTEAVDVAAYPAMPYFNLCATNYNLGRSLDALTACDNAIKADPTMADAYYIKASVLFGKGKVEQGIYEAPPGTRDALNKYLQYAPLGEHAGAVRSMIEKLGRR